MQFKLMKYQLYATNRLFGKAGLNTLTKMEENCSISREISALSQNLNLMPLSEGFGMRVFARELMVNFRLRGKKRSNY